MDTQMLDCPGDGELRAYLDGEVSASRRSYLEQHLITCSRCPDRLSSLRDDASLAERALQEALPSSPDVAAAWRRLRTEPARHGASVQQRSVIPMNAKTYQRWQRPAMAAAAALTVLAFVLIAPLRTAAAQFLDVFRVKQIQVVTFDPEQAFDLRTKLFERIVADEPEERAVTGASEAAQAVGMPVLAPASVPEGYALAKFSVTEPGNARAWVDLEAARALLMAAGLPTDVLPDDPDARVISAYIPPAVVQEYRHGDSVLSVMQVASPEVDVPQGVDAERIGEMGLRLLGYPAEQAADLARSINWATTLVLPVPLGKASAREVTVQGVAGYVLEQQESEEHRDISVVWEKDDVVHVVTGNVSADFLLDVARSLQ